NADFTYCPVPDLPWSAAPVDMFVNVASMQEMNPDQVAGYFDFFRSVAASENLFYCCNRVEKVLPDREVSRFMEYPWEPRDEIVFDERCAFQDYFLNLRTLPRGPRIAGLRVPFVNTYDGPSWHRLARLTRKERISAEARL
ncbi:MAG: hypothetical protein JO317_01935, partial [Verrucomicrobiae bacterium]|nr:hypothetical protein [Verrucomicrobiae bacterium]